MFPLQGVYVRFLVREVRSHMPHREAKKIKTLITQLSRAAKEWKIFQHLQTKLSK